MSTEEGTEVDNHIKAAPIYDDAQLTAMAQDSDYLSIDMETVESLLATAIYQRERANKADEQLVLARGAYDNLEMTCEALRLNQAQTDAEIARLRAVTVAYWARFGAVPEDGENILATERTRVTQLEKIAGDALNELEAALDGKPNAKAREFLGFLKDRLDELDKR